MELEAARSDAGGNTLELLKPQDNEADLEQAQPRRDSSELERKKPNTSTAAV